MPRIRLDQVMYACVQVMLPLSMLVLLGNTLWGLLVRDGSVLDVIVRALCTALGAALVFAFVWFMAYGLRNRRKLVGTLAIDHWPGA